MGLTLDVAIFVYFAHFFLFSFVFLFIFFAFSLLPFIPTADPLQYSEFFLVYVVTGVLVQYLGTLFRTYFKNLCQEVGMSRLCWALFRHFFES